MLRAIRRGPTIALVILAGALAGAAAAWAQHGGHGGAGQAEQLTFERAHLTVNAWLLEFEKVVADGRGFGMAFPADQNGYPGPMHALELKERLRLTPEQEAKLGALMHGMFAESRPKGARLLEAEAKLRGLFATGAADEAAVRAAVADVERARSELRLVHLLTHLKARDVLSEEQRRQYQEARWGGR